MANPLLTPDPAKAPWYFLGLQELLHYFTPLVADQVAKILKNNLKSDRLTEQQVYLGEHVPSSLRGRNTLWAGAFLKTASKFVDSKIIATKGYGESDPLESGESAQARAKNRRVEISIVDSVLRLEGVVPPTAASPR